MIDSLVHLNVQSSFVCLCCLLFGGCVVDCLYAVCSLVSVSHVLVFGLMFVSVWFFVCLLEFAAASFICVPNYIVVFTCNS